MNVIGYTFKFAVANYTAPQPALLQHGTQPCYINSSLLVVIGRSRIAPLVAGAVATVCAARTRGCRDAPGPCGIQRQSVQENLHEPSRKCQVRAALKKPKEKQYKRK